ncbi:MAG: Tat pathway signal sequence domain protein [Kiritimatiellae bacterium]|nr:Tat pathway signal sequence domain protein [Kiritimatiellia bacterium]
MRIAGLPPENAAGRLLVPWLFLAAAAATAATSTDPSDVPDRVVWPEFLARHDLVWERLPARWHEGAFTGNGRLGAMAYIRTNGWLAFDIGHSEVVDRGNRIAIGFFAMRPVGRTLAGTMRLHLWDAEMTATQTTDRGRISWTAFTCADRPVHAVAWTVEGAEAVEPILVHEPAVDARKVFRGEPLGPKDLNPPPQRDEQNTIRTLLQPFREAGGYALAWTVQPAGANGGRLLWSVVPRPDPAAAASNVAEAALAGWPTLVRDHRAWWHSWWPRHFLSIPDTRLEGFYWIQMYKLASAARSDGPAIDLMGPWFRSTPWPRFWWNLNLQLTYWPVYAANRLDVGESLVRMIDRGWSNLIANVPEPFRADSAAVGRTSDHDCRGPAGAEFGNLTWALHNVWLHYRYAGDETLLRERLYPWLRRAAAWMLHQLRPGENGRLHFPEDISPEYPDRARDTHYNLALLRWALSTLLAAHEHLRLDDPEAPRWRDTLARLAPLPVDERTGFMVGAGVPFAQSHRHFSHLLAFYPLHLYDPEDPRQRPLLERSLDHWIGLEGAHQGYSFTGAAAMSAWLGRAEAAAAFLRRFLDGFVQPNTMYLEAGPVIETPLSAAASLHEMLLQSWCMEPFGVQLRVFPAVPADWTDVVIRDMRAEGAFLVSALRRRGATRWIRIQSLAGAPCRVRTGWTGPVIARGSRPFSISTAPDEQGRPVTTVDLRAGERVLLLPAAQPPEEAELAVEPVAADPDRLNWYGSQKAPWVRATPEGVLRLDATSAALLGTRLLRERKSPAGNIGRWTDREDRILWRVRVPRAGTWNVRLRAAGPGAEVRAVFLRATGTDDATPIAVSLTAPATGDYGRFVDGPPVRLILPEAGPWTVQLEAAGDRAPAINIEHVELIPVD